MLKKKRFRFDMDDGVYYNGSVEAHRLRERFVI